MALALASCRSWAALPHTPSPPPAHVARNDTAARHRQPEVLRDSQILYKIRQKIRRKIREKIRESQEFWDSPGIRLKANLPKRMFDVSCV